MFGKRTIVALALLLAVAALTACGSSDPTPVSSALAWDSGAWDQSDWQ